MQALQQMPNQDDALQEMVRIAATIIGQANDNR
jgi:hypothetical protein